LILRVKAQKADGVGYRLVMVREKLGLTQREMADRLNLALGTYGRSEAGRRAIDDGEMAEIGSMGIDLNWLILGHGDIDGPAEFETQAPGRSSRVGTDPTLLGQLIDGIATIYKTQNRQLAADRHGILVAELYDHLIVIADEAERRGAVRYALGRLAEERR
jgi:transcriptional regulator with XRE-family HTH domain